MGEYANDMIGSQKSELEKDTTTQLNEIYSERIAPPTIAYLEQDGFGQEFQDNELINDWMYESLSEIIYVGPFGTTEEISQNFVCQHELCPCRKMMRYVRGCKAVIFG